MGLPRVPSSLRERPVWDRLLIGGVHRLTEWVMSGAEISTDAHKDMKELVRAAEALGRAIEARERVSAIEEEQ